MEGAAKAVTMDEWRAGDKLEKVRDNGQEESGSRGWSIRWVYKSGWVELVKWMGKTAPNKRTTIQQQDPATTSSPISDRAVIGRRYFN